MKDLNKKTSRYNLTLIFIVIFSFAILSIFIFFALTFLIKNINLLVKPETVEKEAIQLNIEKAREIFGNINQ